MTELLKQCLPPHGLEGGGESPRPLGDTVHGTRPGEVMHFDYLYAETAIPWVRID